MANNFQNFGDLDDGQIRLKMREMLLHRATVDRTNYAMFDEEMDKDIAHDIAPDEDRDAFTLNQVSGMGEVKMSCGMPTHMCKCNEGGKKKKKPMFENEQEVVNNAMIRKTLKPMGKKVTKGISEYNASRPKDVSKPKPKKKVKATKVIVINKRESKKHHNKDRDDDESSEFEYKPDPSDESHIYVLGDGKDKIIDDDGIDYELDETGGKKKKRAPTKWQLSLNKYMKDHGVSLKVAMSALGKNK